jgi:hypothetical protein
MDGGREGRKEEGQPCGVVLGFIKALAGVGASVLFSSFFITIILSCTPVASNAL